ncbi:MAG: CcoQ/FixQ family Cbb3-type cytochrome c oxidase assembly chaperone [Pseudomonadota bacterium]
MDIDMGLVRGLLTLAVFVLFLAISFWAYGKNRRSTFDELAAMPLAEDQRVSDAAAVTTTQCEEKA